MATDLKDHLFKELQSFKTPPPKQVAPLPKEGDLAPRHEKLILPEDKPAIIIFLRHCGCPCKLASRKRKSNSEKRQKDEDKMWCHILIHMHTDNLHMLDLP